MCAASHRKNSTTLTAGSREAASRQTKQISRTSKCMPRISVNDKDYLLAIFLLSKLQEIPEGDAKEELHI